MATSTLARLLSLLLLLLPLREFLPASHRPEDSGTGELHPIILVPGLGCTDLEARLTDAYQPSMPRCGILKGKGWFGLWTNVSHLVAEDYMECFEEQARLVYDPAINDYRNLPGVETRVLNFGSASGIHDKNIHHQKGCFDTAREALERIGYRDGNTLFGAPYDFRYAPPLPGQPSQVYSRYFQQLMGLVETASEKSQHKKVILFAHSFGGMVALEFVRNTPLAWRERYIKHLVMAAPVLAVGILQQLKSLAYQPSDMIYVPTALPSFRRWWRSLESSIVDLPSPKVFGHKPIVITRQRNYSAYDMEEFFVAIGFSDGIEPFRRRAVPKMSFFQAPMVPMTCINGVGVRTPRQLVYWEGNYDVAPESVYGDGDGTVNLISMLAFDREMRRQPGQKFKSIKVRNAEHSALILDEWALKRVIEEILEANQVSTD
ncbi:hypothetical protein ACP70R_022927 [Stipagrostis hirtigluma subsp. patula]